MLPFFYIVKTKSSKTGRFERAFKLNRGMSGIGCESLLPFMKLFFQNAFLTSCGIGTISKKITSFRSVNFVETSFRCYKSKGFHGK